MPFTPIAYGIEVTLNMQNSTGQEIVNVFHFKSGSINPSNADVINAGQFVAVDVWGKLRECLSGNVTALSTTARDISVLNGYSITTFISTNTHGTRGGTALPANSAIALSWRGSKSGRRNRGRTYVGVLADSDASGDIITNGLVDALILLATTLITGPSAGGIQFAVRSLADAAVHVITGYVVDTVLDSMRRRLTGRGA